jgi:hypothetical protein
MMWKEVLSLSSTVEEDNPMAMTCSISTPPGIYNTTSLGCVVVSTRIKEISVVLVDILSHTSTVTACNGNTLAIEYGPSASTSEDSISNLAGMGKNISGDSGITLDVQCHSQTSGLGGTFLLPHGSIAGKVI